MENEKLVTFGAYVDNVIGTDRDENCYLDKLECAYVTVPEEWLKTQIVDNGRFRSLNEFWDAYTWDDTDGLLQIAIDDGVLFGIQMGMSIEPKSNEEVLDALTTKFDELYCFLEDGEDIGQLDVNELKGNVNKLVDFLESIGGRVKGIQYIKENDKADV
jgi:hypothetical protein